MKTFNSISGGKTSAYLEVHYPSDYRAFSLVRTNDPRCKYPDAKVRQIVSDRLGVEFIGTLEDDVIIQTVLELEQFTGREIKWVTGKTFDEVIDRSSGIPNLPQPMRRFCTSEMKVIPLFEYWRSLNIDPWECRLGFRANEMRRANNTNKRLNENGFLTQKGVIEKQYSELELENLRIIAIYKGLDPMDVKNRNKWKEYEYQKPRYPLIEDKIFKDKIEEYWKDKPVKFAWMNNCVGCMHKEPLLLKKMITLHPNKLQWFIDKEEIAKQMKGNTWRQDVLYSDIKKSNIQTELFSENDFNECDSGYCGL